MNFFDYALRDFPNNLYKRSGTVFTDIAIPNGSSTSAQTFSVPLVAGSTGASSIGMGSNRICIINENDFIWGKENRQFTLSCVLLPLMVTTDMAVMSHFTAAPRDGISVDQDNIVFRVKFLDGAVVEAKWEFPDFTEAYVVHGVYSPNNIDLYINGELKSSAPIDPEHLASGFDTDDDGLLYGGMTGGANDRVLIDAPASYGYALTPDQIMAQFIAARDTIPMQINVASLGGVAIDGSQRRVYSQKFFDAVNGWDGVAATDVSTTGGELIPQADQTTGQSLSGVWTGLFPLADDDTITSLAGIKAEWNGNGSYSVQTSLDDGLTYQAVTNGELIPSSQGINPAGKTLLIKITFTGGIVDDVSEVRDLTLTSYVNNTIYTSNNDARQLTITGNVSTTLSKNEPIEFNTRPGIHAYGGKMLMSADTDGTAASIQTLEFWIIQKGTNSAYIFDTRPYGGTAYMWTTLSGSVPVWAWAGASAVYINGQLVTSNVTAIKDEPQHIVFVMSAASNTNIDLAIGGQLAEYNLISVYPTALTASQAQQLYQNYTSYPVMAVTEAGVVQFIEPVNPYVLTVADWASLPQQ